MRSLFLLVPIAIALFVFSFDCLSTSLCETPKTQRLGIACSYSVCVVVCVLLLFFSSGNSIFLVPSVGICWALTLIIQLNINSCSNTTFCDAMPKKLSVGFPVPLLFMSALVFVSVYVYERRRKKVFITHDKH